MDRRNLLRVVGSTAVAAGVTVGTGAFTSVTTDRSVSVAVAADANAALRLDDVPESPNDAFVTQTDGTFGIDVSASGNGGTGVNTDAVTLFQDLFLIENQGTQPVDVTVTPLTLFEVSGGDVTIIVTVVPQNGFPTVTLAPGASERYDAIVAATDHATANTTLDRTITVDAEAV